MRVSLVFMICLGLIASCKDWEYPQKFPIVFTEMVININSDGAEFVGRVESLGSNQSIIGHGFVWSISEMPTLNSSSVSISESIQKGIFSKPINYDLAAGKEYNVRAFVQTDNLVVYGNQVKFTSQGSLTPAIVNFTPTKGFDGTEITIEGHNFSAGLNGNLVQIGGISCQVTSASESLLKIKLPTTNLVGDYKISITVAGKSGMSKTEFSILGPRIRSISKLSGRVGDLLTIQGEYFDIGSYMSVYFKSAVQGLFNVSYPYVISANQLECYVPDNPNGVGKVELQSSSSSGQKQFEFPDNFSIVNSWNKISDQTPLGNVNGYRAVSINDLVYVVGGSNLYTFNPVTKVWLQKAVFPGVPRYYGIAFVMNNKLYYGFGEHDFDGLRYNDLWTYDVTTDSWSFIMNAPIVERSRLIAFAINGKAYIGFGFSKINFSGVSYNDFWKFDPTDNSWTQVVTPLTNQGDYRSSCFTINNKGYLFGVMNTLWEFDPAASNWSRKKDLVMSTYYGNPALSLGSSGIVFSGSQYGASNRVYEYNPSKDIWITKQTCPASGRIGELAVYSNGKVYYGLGAYTNANSSTPDFWELTLQ